jgi:rare lipoprotein A
MTITTATSFLLAAVIACLLFQLVTPAAQTPAPSKVTRETGIAIFYSDKLQGRRLTTGEKYDKNALTAAHRTLPLGTMVKVTNLKNNKSVVVRINDRGPHGSKERIIDLSGRAAEDLDMIKDGKAKVKLEVVKSPKK